MDQTLLYQKYCIDTSAILDFWDTSHPRPYPVKVQKFRTLWDHISNKIETGVILLPKSVFDELTPEDNDFKEWLKSHRSLVVDEASILNELTSLVNEYPIYTTARASLCDAVVVALGKHFNLTVISSEKYVPNPSPANPKIPNVCQRYSVKCLDLPSFFVEEGL